MLSKALNDKKSQENKKLNLEIPEEDFDQINKDINKALVDMKKDKEEEEIDDESEEEIIENFDRDFFSDSSNSISFDNFSDNSEKSFKSANVEMKSHHNKNNLFMNNFNNINNINNKSFSKAMSPDIHLNINRNNNHQNQINNNINIEKNNKKNNIFNPNNNFINNSKINDNNKTAFFNDNSQFQLNQINNPMMRFDNMNPNPNQNNNNNNPIMQLNNNNYIPNFDLNNFPNIQPINFPMNNSPNLQIINNNINNNLNFINTIPNNLMNNQVFNNINDNMNRINNINNNKYSTNYKKSNSALFSYPAISDRGVPGMYNLDSPKNIINLENILKFKDKRTTLIIRNIPNKYTILLLLEELNHNFENKYDIVYLPQDYINNSNLGFGFINFLDPMHLILFYEEFVGKKWNYFNSKKRCNLAYSKYQGRNELTKYIQTKLGISNLDNNSQKIKKSIYMNNKKNMRAPIEIPLKYATYFMSFHPYSICRQKDDKVFIIDKY